MGVTKEDFGKAVAKSFTNDGTWLDPQQLIKNGGDGSKASDKTETVSNESSARPKVTIASVNGGKDWLDIPDLQKEFGIIEGTVEFNDVSDPAQLLARAQAWIKAQSISESWSVTAVELGLPNFNHFNVADRYQFINPYVATTQLLRVTQKEVDLLKPHSSTLTIGDKAVSLTAYQLENNRARTDFQRVKVMVSQLATAQSSSGVTSNPVVESAESSQEVVQLQFDIEQLKKVIQDQIPTGYVSASDFQKLKEEVEAMKGSES